MNTATMNQAQGLRQQIGDMLGKLRAFSIQMYRAHGGWSEHDVGPAEPASPAPSAAPRHP